MRRRQAFVTLFALLSFSAAGQAQMSQRARQMRDRRACEQDLPTCKPSIRVQLDAERRRIRIGLAVLAVGVLAMTGVLVRRYRHLKEEEQEDLDELHERVGDYARDSKKKSAK